jgi:hypothetical protein
MSKYFDVEEKKQKAKVNVLFRMGTLPADPHTERQILEN